MQIVRFDDSHTAHVVALWNKHAGTEMPYKPFTEESFKQTFIDNPHFSYEGTFVGIENGKIIAFANGVFKREFLPHETHENTPGYLTFILVDREHREKGYGTAMLRAVEAYFKENGKREIQVIFFNPINLSWNIPGTCGHDHPNAPGVDIGGLGYKFLKGHGYKERTREVAMYLDLSEFKLPDKTKEKLKELRSKGIEIEYYDAIKHPKGFDELFDNLRHEHWRRDIQDNLELDDPHPILVASDRGKICGFAGPIAAEPSGRGWFCGIGVDPNYGGHGIGTTMFFMLMDSFKEVGAKFSSLFTGENNPAKKMYDRAGFKEVKTWAVMGKEI